MHRPFYFRFIVATLAISSVGCSSMFGDHGVFRGKSKDYLKTGTLQPVVVPEDLNSLPLEELYYIPEVNPKDEFGDLVTLKEYEVPRPNEVNLEKGDVGVKIQRIGDNRWIFLNASTSQVWPRTQNFLSEFGIRVANSDPETGLIETQDVVFNDDSSRKSRYRIFIEKGVHPETTEIHVIQIEAPIDQAFPDADAWPEKSHNQIREDALVDDLASTLAENVNNNSASLLGQNVGGSLKVQFLKTQQEPTMQVNLFRSRAVATVGHALDKDGFMLWDKLNDGSHDVFYVALNEDKAKKRGFLRRLFTSSAPKEAPYSISQVIQHLSDEDDVKAKFSDIDSVAFSEALPHEHGFLVLVSTAGKSSDVVIRDMRGRKLPPATAKELLRTIRKNLI